MLAEPNKTKCKIKVLNVESSHVFSDKILLKVEILSFEEQHDKRFIKTGEVMEAFTFDQINIAPDEVFLADAEYIGGPGGGTIHLTNLKNV